MKVLHVMTPDEVGGLDRVVHSLAAGLQGRGHDVHVAAVVERPVDRLLLTQIREDGVTVHTIPATPRGYRAERSALAAVCREIGPDVLHTHGFRADIIDAPVGRQLGIPIMSTVHGSLGGSLRERAYELVQRRALRSFDLVVAVARPHAVELARAGVPPARIRVVPNAWCPDREPLDPERARASLGVPADRFHVGWVGRLGWEKGADILLDALAQLGDLPLVVSIVGDGIERRALEDKARKLNLRPTVTWWGTLSGASRFFPGFDAFVLSSRTEGTPLVLFEAMRAHVPIIAAAVGGVPDVVSPDEALLVAPRDPEALAEALRATVNDRVAAAERAQRARERLADYAADPWLDRYTTLYQALRPRRVLEEMRIGA